MILEEALRLYPGDARLERLWGLAREKRKLVNSILSLARLYEQGGNYGEALGQWQTLQIVHPDYPGLDSEIARLEKLRRPRGARDITGRDEATTAQGPRPTKPLDYERRPRARGDMPGDLQPQARGAGGAASPPSTGRPSSQKPSEAYNPPRLDDFPEGGRASDREVGSAKHPIWKEHPNWVLAGVSTIVMIAVATIIGIMDLRRVAPEIQATPPEASMTANKEMISTAPSPEKSSSGRVLLAKKVAESKGQVSASGTKDGSTKEGNSGASNPPVESDATSPATSAPPNQASEAANTSNPPAPSHEAPSIEYIKIFTDASPYSPPSCAKVSDQTEFQRTNVSFIKFCVLLLGAPGSSGTLGVRYIAPDGTIQRVTPTDDFTFTKPLAFGRDIGLTTMIRGWGSTAPGSFGVGTWRIEFYWGSVKIGERSFEIE